MLLTTKLAEDDLSASTAVIQIKSMQSDLVDGTITKSLSFDEKFWKI